MKDYTIILKAAIMNLAHRVFLDEADRIAKQSPDPSSKIGALLVSNFEVVGAGFNSFPLDSIADPLYYNDRPLKYDRIIHAEMRCLLQAGQKARGGRLYTGCPPCKDCAKHIAEAGVAEVCFWSSRMNHSFVQRFPENIHVAMLIFAECGVKVVEVPDGQ